MRYGDVRKTSLGQVGIVVEGLMTRICIGLPAACSSLNEEAAEKMFTLIQAVQDVVSLLANENFNALWHGVLTSPSNQLGLHGLLAGRCCRLLLQADHIDAEPVQSAAWTDGFLRGSGQLLIYDEVLWGIIDAWAYQLPAEAFQQILPMLRRTFSTFDAPIRRQMGERLQHKLAVLAKTTVISEHNTETAKAVLQLLVKILGLEA